MEEDQAISGGCRVADRWRQASAKLGPFTDLSPCWKKLTLLHTQDPPAHTGVPQTQTQKVISVVTIDKYPKAGYTQCLTATSTWTPPKWPRHNTRVVGFRPYQSSMLLATQAAHPKGDPSRHQILLGTTPSQKQHLKQGDWGLPV